MKKLDEKYRSELRKNLYDYGSKVAKHIKLANTLKDLKSLQDSISYLEVRKEHFEKQFGIKVVSTDYLHKFWLDKYQQLLQNGVRS